MAEVLARGMLLLGSGYMDTTEPFVQHWVRRLSLLDLGSPPRTREGTTRSLLRLDRAVSRAYMLETLMKPLTRSRWEDVAGRVANAREGSDSAAG